MEFLAISWLPQRKCVSMYVLPPHPNELSKSGVQLLARTWHALLVGRGLDIIHTNTDLVVHLIRALGTAPMSASCLEMRCVWPDLAVLLLLSLLLQRLLSSLLVCLAMPLMLTVASCAYTSEPCTSMKP